jgi:hypothetical protein
MKRIILKQKKYKYKENTFLLETFENMGYGIRMKDIADREYFNLPLNSKIKTTNLRYGKICQIWLENLQKRLNFKNFEEILKFIGEKIESFEDLLLLISSLNMPFSKPEIFKIIFSFNFDYTEESNGNNNIIKVFKEGELYGVFERHTCKNEYMFTVFKDIPTCLDNLYKSSKEEEEKCAHDK